ncbi:large conductance mechanosensitive channel protein MscL [Terrimonas sp. NA20]|uniref:Large-conductance mechanosensitive channel n=1 Tax=Terrimonas ginsenosidimutans TaxID=2908004 RepID=A0ABS9KQ36_9BACT|nr:large conductance mechanosensitive channel protein MscL [Terrimonas ginsenosidimutans]MCG2614410.1 large conductance mechanosensitive channel protein MscL [Terrimonas ginsenosidimutans]
MGLFKEFKEFALKKNVVELAVAVIIGAAFGTIVSSLVDDVITPLLLTPALEAANAQDLDKLVWGNVKYGKFLAAVIKFVIIAFILFLIIRAMKGLMKKEEEAPTPAVTPEDILLLREIRDSLKK